MSVESLKAPLAPLPDMVDQQFNVVRSSGEVEQGWSVKGVYDRTLEGGSVVPTAIIHRPAGDGQHDFVKNIPVDTLRSWQSRQEEQKAFPQGRLGEAAITGVEAPYDHLFRVDNGELDNDESGIAQTEPTQERVRDPRLEKLFAPIPTIDQIPNAEPERYDHLFNEDENEYQKQAKEFAARADRRTAAARKHNVVTDKTRQIATEQLARTRSSNPVINTIVSKYEGQDPQISAVDLIRTNPELRYELGSYLYHTRMGQRMHRMGERIVFNDEKSPHHSRDSYSRFGKLRSQEYATLLALAMLDGTFSGSPNGDGIERDKSGKPKVGQHRGAAEDLLV